MGRLFLPGRTLPYRFVILIFIAAAFKPVVSSAVLTSRTILGSISVAAFGSVRTIIPIIAAVFLLRSRFCCGCRFRLFFLICGSGNNLYAEPLSQKVFRRHCLLFYFFFYFFFLRLFSLSCLVNCGFRFLRFCGRFRFGRFDYRLFCCFFILHAFRFRKRRSDRCLNRSGFRHGNAHRRHCGFSCTGLRRNSFRHGSSRRRCCGFSCRSLNL